MILILNPGMNTKDRGFIEMFPADFYLSETSLIFSDKYYPQQSIILLTLF